MEGGAQVWKCCRCDQVLVPKKVVLEYLGHTVSHELPTCPSCARVYISEELAEGKMAEVEQLLEDK